MSGLVDLVVEHPGWEQALPDLGEIAEGAATLALTGAGLVPEGFALDLLACDDDRIAALNARFRGKSAPTNVLSWPAEDLSPDIPGGPPQPPERLPGMPCHLGDVAIALQTVEREAAEADIPLKDHAMHLILHGVLHLLGFDHETEEDASRMEGLESRLLTGIGLADPYATGDRAPSARP